MVTENDYEAAVKHHLRRMVIVVPLACAIGFVGVFILSRSPLHGLIGVPLGWVVANMVLITLHQLGGPGDPKWNEIMKRRRQQRKAD